MRQTEAPITAGPPSEALSLRSSRQRDVVKPRAHHDALLVRPSWRGPLPRPVLPGRPRVDAFVVPAGRSHELTAGMLGRLAALAGRLRAVLVVLASHAADPAALAAGRLRAPHVAVLDLSEGRAAAWQRLLPDFGADAHPLGRLSLDDDWDTAAKRNVGLALARAFGWRKVVFLDDDILFSGSAPFRLRELAVGCSLVDRGLLTAAGWVTTDFPDNSVVCHARRLARLEQGVFVGAGALLVGVDDRTPFFPRIYNEDWLFQYPLLRSGPDDVGRLAVLGEVRQRPYDPFSKSRAKREELGDLLAEGLYQLRDGAVRGLGVQAHDAEDPAHWKEVIAERAAMVRRVADRLTVTPQDRSTADRQRSRALVAKRVLRGVLARPVRPLWRRYQTVHRARVRDQAGSALVVALRQHDVRPDGVTLADALASWVAAWRIDLETWRRHTVPADLARQLLLDPATTPWLGSEVLPPGAAGSGAPEGW